jgi:NADH:ubiquinone oxidoreductase subunit 6 (subunit J)
MAVELTILLSVLLVGVTLSGLLIKRLVYSLIMLFYSGLLLGCIFLAYGASYAGLFQIITFAGAVSVMFMVILMLIGGELTPTGQRISREQVIGLGLSIIGFLVVASILWQFGPSPIPAEETVLARQMGFATDDPLSFLWSLRSWDVLFLVILVSAALAGILNLFSKEGDHE